MKYYIYHIPGKKIGVTCDIYNRVTQQQGYEEDEYKILDMSEDINYISNKEIELQKQYGYKVDRKLYKNLKTNKPMKINVTEQTTTFPCPVDKLKARLFDVIGMDWDTEHGKFVIDKKSIKWIMKNVKTSMYNDNRCYVYNRALSRHFDKREQLTIPLENNQLEIFSKIRDWADERGLYDHGDVKTQYVKLQEEAGELAKALLQNDEAEIVDGIGDMIVVLTNLSHLSGVDIETCIESAYKEISTRDGRMINGTFVKHG
jgi:NTP pyrophosphatase (non-canonical NTP hydrolase)